MPPVRPRSAGKRPKAAAAAQAPVPPPAAAETTPAPDERGITLEDPEVTCWQCGYTWKLVWVVARALFKEVGPRRYECGPTSCPQCDPRIATFWGNARTATAASFSRAAPVNVPSDDQRAKSGPARPPRGSL